MTDNLSKFIQDELALVTRMIGIACVAQHDPLDGELCDECRALCAYVKARLLHCPYGAEKPTCRKCPIHCYRPIERERIKEVMRLAGPRMVCQGDLTALRHVLHGLLPAPGKPGRRD